MEVSETDPLVATDSELAQLLGVSPRHIWNLDRNGKIGPSPVYLGKSRRWSREEVRQWLAAGAPDRETWQSRKQQLCERPN